VAEPSPCGRWPCGQATPIIAPGTGGQLSITWPDDRPEVFPCTPEALEGFVQTINAYRCADAARAAGRWWAPWRWFHAAR
jgi:hypothetical protein